MKTILPLACAALLAALALLPGASAAEIPPSGEKTVGPCTYSYNWWWPGSYSILACAAEGQELLYYGSWETWGGTDCQLRVLGQKVYGCNEQ